MHQKRRPARAPTGLRRVVLSLVLTSLSVIALLGLGGCESPYPGEPSEMGPEPGRLEAVPSGPSLQVGEMAPDFTLRDLEGRPARLSDYRGRMPVLVEFGSITCPIVTDRVSQLDTLAQDYQGEAQFWFIYGNEEHPGQGEMRSSSFGTFQALPQVQDYGERCGRAQLFRSTVQTSRRVLVDEDGAGSVAARYGFRGHGIVLVDIQGRIGWIGTGLSNLADLMEALAGPPSPRRDGA